MVTTGMENVKTDKREYLRKWKEAHPDYQRKWRAAHPGWNAERCRKYGETHKEEPREYQRNWHKAHREHSNEKSRKWRMENPESAQAATKGWASRNGHKLRASVLLRKAVKRGKIIRKSCVICGNPKTDAHHQDYKKPFDVIWLCPEHHRLIHRLFATRNGNK